MKNKQKKETFHRNNPIEINKKYNMTRQYFEDKYINRVIDDDVIEKHINAQIQSESEEDIKIKNIIIDANIKSPNISDEEFNTKSDNPEKNIF